MPTPILSTALATTRDAWLAGNPDAWALYRSCCDRLPAPAPSRGADAHRAQKAVASQKGWAPTGR